ncbi:LLM class flavin-dependent oxidoreductase [Paractinoplanes atraurantiacus]|uniref:Flavin-dependent oxidoreductase, luciferase family (Includes alkanesulfonate monooxygenase SsuD and methylene tetrahydromethanopterin reductase) n=1 Tax=Paractinoplanes atraurantiacus TaxID=1036182 RepID=A0A285II79_9ACTN|nr:LLM class flavin-dependent oxidoreductase [Actinoplanes atraurantiacus]SNY47679.1 Flavin-dependent oxidoreductase, luciferase family (includes alkanesulfonate monooxygenase SsuD and methylene tetrahydromethanopterin reductase) [Actinoplanes atraurantiacus]
MTIQIGVSTLTDLPRGMNPARRMEQIVDLGAQADEAGLDVFGVGEHHSADFLVSSPAPVLSAVAARTRNIRLTSAVTVLSVHDPVRVWQDFATVDLISGGRAEITVGRSAYPDPFALFGVDLSRYDKAFTERLDLLLRLCDGDDTPWPGGHRPPLVPADVVPRPVQDPLPVWIGAGGSPGSALRAGAAGLPLILGYIGGSPDDLRRLADLYRAAGGTQVGLAVHFFAAATEREARDTYTNYRDFLPFPVSAAAFDGGLRPGGHLFIGTSEQITEKLARLHDAVPFDRVQALVDWGGLDAGAVRDSVYRLGAEVAPALRETGRRGTRLG